ncbi:MAG TPA: class I SAM-dependent methyltransferase [Herpetosiphonaceae bacterium]|nr:class I SAM-dependent methyltransferase [Herpetosiphonaceae bacterium]
MECIQGKYSLHIDRAELDRRLAAYSAAHIDIGTGDGRFALDAARRRPDLFVIGLDACRDSVREASRRAPANVLFVVANVADLPAELAGRASGLSVNFPWGSLLKALISDEPAVLDGLVGLGRPGFRLELMVNGEALATLGSSLERGGAQIRRGLIRRGLDVAEPAILDRAALRAIPTTWARRLAFGRDPRALYCQASRPAAAPAVAWEELALGVGA